MALPKALPAFNEMIGYSSLDIKGKGAHFGHCFSGLNPVVKYMLYYGSDTVGR